MEGQELVAFTVCAVKNFRTAIQQVSLYRSHPFTHNSSFTWLCEYGPTEPCCNSDHVGISDVFIGFELSQFIILFQFSRFSVMWGFPKCWSCLGCKKVQRATARPVPPHHCCCFNLEMPDGSGPAEHDRKLRMLGLKHDNRTDIFLHAPYKYCVSFFLLLFCQLQKLVLMFQSRWDIGANLLACVYVWMTRFTCVINHTAITRNFHGC